MWREALRLYDTKQQQGEGNEMEIAKGKLNCYRNLYDWENLSSLVEFLWDQYDKEDELSSAEHDKDKVKYLKDLTEVSAYSAWNLGKWDTLTTYVKQLDPIRYPYERYFYSAILDIRQSRFSDA